MDDKRKRELSAAVDRGPTDAATQKLVAKDPQAKAYFDGLLTVDRALRAWPTREPSAVDSFVDSVLARLDEPSSSDFDPLSAPFADERELETPPRHHSEQQAMSQSNDQDNEDDLEGLAALMRPSRTGSSASVPPPPVSVRPGPALTDDAMDESSGIVDIKHLASIAKRASIPPATEAEAKPEAKADAPSAEKPAEAKADAKKSDDKDAKDSAKKSDAKAESKGSADSAKKGSSDGAKKADKAEAGAKKSSEASEKKPLQAVPAPTASESSESKKGTSPFVWIGVIGIAAAGAFYVGRSGNQSAPAVNAEQAPQSANASTAAAGTQSQPSTPSGAPVVAAPVAANAPAAQPAAPSQPETPTQPAAAPPPVDQGATGAGTVATQPTPTAAPSTGSAAIGGALGATGSGAQGSPAESEAANERSARRAPSGASAGSGGGARDNSVQEQRAQAASEPARPPGNAAATPTTTTTRTTTAASASATAPTTTTASTTPTAPAGRGSSTATGSTASEGAPAAGAGGTGARPRSVEELMRAATGADRAEALQRQNQQVAAAQTAALPPQLTTTMVRSTMSPFNSQVRACAQGQTGSATAVITVSGDGSVQNVVVSSPWGSGPNECISNRLRTARFPAVQRATSRVVVPFQVNPSQPGG